MKKNHPFPIAWTLAGLATLALVTPASAGVVFSDSFESPVLSGSDDHTVRAGGKWNSDSLGFGSGNCGLYHETGAWPAIPAFATPSGIRANYLSQSTRVGTVLAPATGTALHVDAWFGTDRAALTQVVNGAPNTSHPPTPPSILATTSDGESCRNQRPVCS